MKLLDYLVSVCEWWLTLATIAALAWCVCVTRLKARSRADVTRRASYPPPVPRPVTPPYSQTLPAADLFDGMPVDCLSDDAVHSLFDSIVAGEFK